jgi:hypothetical protein
VSRLVAGAIRREAISRAQDLRGSSPQPTPLAAAAQLNDSWERDPPHFLCPYAGQLYHAVPLQHPELPAFTVARGSSDQVQLVLFFFTVVCRSVCGFRDRLDGRAVRDVRGVFGARDAWLALGLI